ncbi:MAG: hypothetical protein V3T64_07530 [Myxococcota bacterium]
MKNLDVLDASADFLGQHTVSLHLVHDQVADAGWYRRIVSTQIQHEIVPRRRSWSGTDDPPESDHSGLRDFSNRTLQFWSCGNDHVVNL